MAQAASPSWARQVDGCWLPAPWGGHPVLDFCNTLAGWGGPEQHDYLTTFEHVVLFSREAGLMTDAVAHNLVGRQSPAQFVGARGLRAATYAALTGAAGEHEWTVLAAVAHEAAHEARLLPADPGARWSLPVALGVRLPLLSLATAVADFLVSPSVSQVSRCPGDGCGWLFLNTRGRRKWCSMAVCGNRSKVREHAARTREAGVDPLRWPTLNLGDAPEEGVLMVRPSKVRPGVPGTGRGAGSSDRQDGR